VVTTLQKVIGYFRLQRKERRPVRLDGRDEQPVALLANPDFFDLRRETQILWQSHGLVGAIAKYRGSPGDCTGHGPPHRLRRRCLTLSKAPHRILLSPPATAYALHMLISRCFYFRGLIFFQVMLGEPGADVPFIQGPSR